MARVQRVYEVRQMLLDMLSKSMRLSSLSEKKGTEILTWPRVANSIHEIRQIVFPDTQENVLDSDFLFFPNSSFAWHLTIEAIEKSSELLLYSVSRLDLRLPTPSVLALGVPMRKACHAGVA